MVTIYQHNLSSLIIYHHLLVITIFYHNHLNMVSFLEPFYHSQWGVDNRELCGNLAKELFH